MISARVAVLAFTVEPDAFTKVIFVLETEPSVEDTEESHEAMRLPAFTVFPFTVVPVTVPPRMTRAYRSVPVAFPKPMV
jgi:hypothetical protein